MHERFIPEVDEPERYRLDATPNSITLDIHKKAIPRAFRFYEPDIDQNARDFRIPYSFIPPSPDREWGVGPVLSQTDSPDPDFIRLVCNLPMTDRWDHVDLLARSATLGPILTNLRYPDSDTGSKNPQMLLVEMALINNPGGEQSPIDAWTSPSLTKWLVEKANVSDTDQISRTMYEAWKTMQAQNKARYPKMDLPRIPDDFRVDIKAKKILLYVPGNAGGLAPDQDQWDTGDEGYYMISHNNEFPVQQLTLLAGLAKLYFLSSQNR